MSDVFGFLKDGVKKRAWAICLVTMLYKLYLKDFSFITLNTKYDDYITIAFILSFTSLFSDFLYYMYSTIIACRDFRVLSKCRKVLEKVQGKIEVCDTGDKRFESYIFPMEEKFSKKIIGIVRVYAEKNINCNLYSFYKDKTSVEINTLIMSRYIINGLTRSIDNYYANPDESLQGKQLIKMLEDEKGRVNKLKLFVKEIYSEEVYLENKYVLIKVINPMLNIILSPIDLILLVLFLPFIYWDKNLFKSFKNFWTKKIKGEL